MNSCADCPDRPSNLWRYQDILPLNDPAALDLYPAGGTPLWLSDRFAPGLGAGLRLHKR